MRKGDERKQEMLRTAERLFCSKGYDETSVQDILDEVHGSKGGFYHHFVSKDDVLKTLCQNRASDACISCGEKLKDVQGSMSRINMVFHWIMPFHSEELSFLGMLLPILDRPESFSVRACYQQSLSDAFHCLLEQEIQLGQADHTLQPVTQGLSPILLQLVNACWYELALLMLRGIRRNQKPEPSDVLEILRPYRKSIETLLDAPYGGILLIGLDEFDAAADRLLRIVRTPLYHR